jgi:hypothetical protein
MFTSYYCLDEALPTDCAVLKEKYCRWQYKMKQCPLHRQKGGFLAGKPTFNLMK